MTKKWTADMVIRAIKELRKRKQAINSYHIQKTNSSLYNAARKHFGNWPQAITAAGLDYGKVRLWGNHRKRIWSKDVITNIIQRLHALGEKLNSGHIQIARPALYGASVKYFGGWPQAVKAAGLTYEKIRLKVHSHHWTKGKVLREIRRRHKNGLSIGGGTVANENSSLYQAAVKFFGKDGWTKARRAAGFRHYSDPRVIWTKDRVVNEIQELHEAGALLHTGAITLGKYKNLHAAARKLFGSWRKALQEAKLDPDEIMKTRPKGYWNKMTILNEIKRLEAQGIRLNSTAIQSSHGDLFSAAIIHFGAWGTAVEAAGFSYREHWKVFSSKTWINRLSESKKREILSRAKELAKKGAR